MHDLSELGPILTDDKKRYQSRIIVEGIPLFFFFLCVTTLNFEMDRDVGTPHPPLAKVAKYGKRAMVNISIGVYHQRLFSTLRSVLMIFGCPVFLKTDWYVSFLEKNAFPPCPWQGGNEDLNVGQKIKFFNPFDLGSKICALIRGFQIWSHN